MAVTTHLDQFLEPLAESLTPEVAQRIVNMKADADQQARIDELAAKANEGLLTPEEELEYREIVEAIDIISIIQSKARRSLNQS